MRCRMERLFEQFKVYLLTEKRVSTNTLEAYSADLRQLLDFITEKALCPEKIRQSDLKEFLAILKKQELSARSMARKVSSIKAFFGYISRYHGLENCSESLIFPKIDQRLPKCLSESDIEALLTVAAADQSKMGLRNRAMLSLLYVTGMRISELTGLRITDIRHDVHLLAVRGKGGKGRLIPVPETILALIDQYRQSSIDVLRDKHPAIEDVPFVFPVYYKGGIKPMTRQACWSIIKKVWAKTGIQKKISPHMLRHSLATHMLKNGADLRSLQMLLGHENLATVQIYTHLDTSYVRSIYDAKHPRS
jgi:integrase/recombinase XerD